MDRRLFMKLTGSAALASALPVPALASRWPASVASFKPSSYSEGGEQPWILIHAHIDEPAHWSEQYSAMRPARTAGEPYVVCYPSRSKESALRDRSAYISKSGRRLLAVVQGGTCVRPPAFFNGKCGLISGNYWDLELHAIDADMTSIKKPIVATWYEGQGL